MAKIIEVTNQSSSFREQIPFLLLKLVKFLDGCSFYLLHLIDSKRSTVKKGTIWRKISLNLNKHFFLKEELNIYEVFDVGYSFVRQGIIIN